MTPKYSGSFWILVSGSKLFGPFYMVSGFKVCLMTTNIYLFSMCDVGFPLVGSDKTTKWTSFHSEGSPYFVILENYAFGIG